ncbi:MAG: hypothetical protein U0136_18435 [Bdellovibrionota bacterium]
MTERASREELLGYLQSLFNCRSGLHHFLRKAEAGQATTVAFFGASQTAIRGWAQKTFTFLQTLYPQTPLRYENASQGGVDLFLANRFVATKLLPLEPDLVFLEFTPSSGTTKPERAAVLMEQLLHTLFEALPQTDFCYVHCPDRTVMNERLSGGEYPRQVRVIERLMAYYDIPTINFIEHVLTKMLNDEIVFDREHYNELRQKLSREEIAKRIHYSVEGHPIIGTGDEICLEVMKQALPVLLANARPRMMPEPPRMLPKPSDATLSELIEAFSDETKSIGDLGLTRGELPSLKRFTNLRHLNLTGVSITSSELSFAECPKLTGLKLQMCDLQMPFPDLRHNPQLKQLGLAWNRLYGAVPSFEENPQLELLALGHNELETLPERFELPKLKFFELSHNSFEGDAPDFRGCKSLELLALDENAFSGTLPDVSELPLKNLHLYGCKFTSYDPGSFFNPGLATVILGLNPLEREAVYTILYDFVILSERESCLPKHVDLMGCLCGESQERDLIEKLRSKGWTIIGAVE